VKTQFFLFAARSSVVWLPGFVADGRAVENGQPNGKFYDLKLSSNLLGIIGLLYCGDVRKKLIALDVECGESI